MGAMYVVCLRRVERTVSVHPKTFRSTLTATFWALFGTSYKTTKNTPPSTLLATFGRSYRNWAFLGADITSLVVFEAAAHATCDVQRDPCSVHTREHEPVMRAMVLKCVCAHVKHSATSSRPGLLYRVGGPKCGHSPANEFVVHGSQARQIAD